MRSPLSLVIVIAASLFAFGCNQAKLSPAPDASPNCAAPVLEYPCAAQANGTPGCAADLDAGEFFDRSAIVLDGSFPYGCTVIVNFPVPDDNDNQCSQLGTCRCEGDAGLFGWNCRK